jgi:3-oxoacyl-(acyl-carrier-protein) synthase
MTPERVVVTGLGVVAPNAHGTRAFSQALRDGTSGIRFVPEMRDSKLNCQVAGVPQGIDELAPQYLSEEELRVSSQGMTFASIAALDAWKDAGLPRSMPESNEVDWESGAIIGTGCGSTDVAGKMIPLVDAGQARRLGSTMVEQALLNGSSARVAAQLGLGNQVSTNAAACSTGNEAVIDAFWRIRDGRVKRVLAGGAEAPAKYNWAAADSMKVLCRTHNDAPEKASRPMSASAAGFVPAAGAGVLLLESLSSAQERGARIYAEVLGGYANCGGQRMGGSISAPNPEGVRRCIRAAISMAGVRPEEIDAINGHLTATFADPMEVDNWFQVLGLPPARMPLIQATKSLIGHAFGAAGGIECVATVLELDQGFLHGSVNCEDLHPALVPYADRIPHTTVLMPRLRVMAKASFGFGDVNACIVFRKFDS